MKLSKAERLILANQYVLLSKYDDYMSKEMCDNNVEILLNGYEYLYDEIFSGMDETISSERSRFVIDVFNMYRKIAFSFSNLDTPETLSEESIAFKGFDGNYETGEYAFSNFVLKNLKMYNEISENKFMKFNSHSSSIKKYQSQLDAFNRIIGQKDLIDTPQYLTEKEIKLILNIN